MRHSPKAIERIKKIASMSSKDAIKFLRTERNIPPITDEYQPAIYKGIEGFARKYYYVSDYKDEECVRFRFFDQERKEWINYFCDEENVKIV